MRNGNADKSLLRVRDRGMTYEVLRYECVICNAQQPERLENNF